MSEPTVRSARPRIVDVATRAGVSRQTVSNVINGRDGFTEETRAKVEAAIAELGFQPNRYAQSLRSLRTMLLGFEMSTQQLDVTNPFTVAFLRSLVLAAEGHGYRIVVFAHQAGEQGFRNSASAGVVDGFVLSDSPPGDYRPRVLAELGVPFVALGRTAAELPQTWVDIDNRQAMFGVVDHLVARGHRRYAYVGYPLDVYWNVERLAGATERLAFHGLSFPDQATLIGTPAELRPGITALLKGPERPDVVVTSSDALALMVLNIAHGLELRVGVDVAVTGFDAGPFATMVEPTLTSVHMPIDELAAALVNHLVADLQGGARSSRVVIPTRLVVGGSA